MSIQLSWTHLPGPGYMWYFIQNSYATSVLYYNGQVGVPSGARVSSVRLYGANDAYQNMTIDLVCAQDSGYLDASLMLSTYSYLYYGYGSNQFHCPSQYYSFVTQTLGITSIQLDSTTLTFSKSWELEINNVLYQYAYIQACYRILISFFCSTCTCRS